MFIDIHDPKIDLSTLKDDDTVEIRLPYQTQAQRITVKEAREHGFDFNICEKKAIAQQVITPGTVTIYPDGKVCVSSDLEIKFLDPDMSGCQEAWHVGACWALEQIANAMAPAGKDKRSLD